MNSSHDLSDIFQKLWQHCNQEQKTFIQTPLQSMKLIGVPGAGKSTTIVTKILYHYLKKNFICPLDYLMITFSKQAQQDFLQKGKKYAPRFFQSTNIRTLHSLSIYLLQFSPNPIHYTLSSVILHATNFILSLQPQQLYTIPLLSHCQIIFVDEAQDINETQYQLLQAISKIYQIPICCIGDPNQSIYQFQGGNEIYMTQHNGATFPVVKNYRSTFELIQFANHFLPNPQFSPPIQCGTLQHGEKPRFFFESYQKIREDLILSLRTSPYAFEQIAILSPVRKAKPLGIHYYKNMGLYWICNILMEEGIPFQLQCGNSGTSDNEKKPGHIQLYTFHGSKGLEWDQVFVLNFHWQFQGSNPTSENAHNARYLWYVAFTRAKKEMTIYGLSSKLVWKDFATCPPNTYFLDPLSKPPLLPKEGKTWEYAKDPIEKDQDSISLDQSLSTPYWKKEMVRMDQVYQLTKTCFHDISIHHTTEEEKKDGFGFFTFFKFHLHFYFFYWKHPQSIQLHLWQKFLHKEKQSLYISKKDSFLFHSCWKIYKQSFPESARMDQWSFQQMKSCMNQIDKEPREWLEKKWKSHFPPNGIPPDDTIWMEYENGNQRVMRQICLDLWSTLEKKRQNSWIGWEEIIDLLFYKYQKEEECKFLYQWFSRDACLQFAKNYWHKWKKVYDKFNFSHGTFIDHVPYSFHGFDGHLPLVFSSSNHESIFFFITNEEKEQGEYQYRLIKWWELLSDDYPTDRTWYIWNIDSLEIINIHIQTK